MFKIFIYEKLFLGKMSLVGKLSSEDFEKLSLNDKLVIIGNELLLKVQEVAEKDRIIAELRAEIAKIRDYNGI
jgi:lipopolysaccharide export system protein LptA